MAPADPDRLKELYTIQKQDSSYQNFLKKTNVSLFGTIDDHDMGMNNGDETYEFKAESGVEFLNFIGEDKNSAMYRRAKSGHGVYGVRVFDFDRKDGDFLLSDVEGDMDPDVLGFVKKTKQKQYKEKRVAVFVLDVRTNKTPWGHGLKAWSRDYDGDFLGERQWEWFETALNNSDATVNIIVNGLQVHPFRHPNAELTEMWSHFPRSRQRLYDTILSSNVRAPVLISGDIHMAQLMRKYCIPRGASSSLSIRPLVEFTTSGMTHSWGSVFSAKMINTKWYYPMHIFSKATMLLTHNIVPMADLIESKYSPNYGDSDKNIPSEGGKEGAKQGIQYSLEKNFGEIEFDWDARMLTIRAFGEEMKKKSRENESSPLLSASFSFDQLSGLEGTPKYVNIDTFHKSDHYLVDGDIIPGSEYICMNGRGHSSVVHFYLGIIGAGLFILMYLLAPQIFIVYSLMKRLKNYERRKKVKTK